MLNYIYVSINFCLPGCTHRTLEEDDDEEVEYDYDNDEHDFKILMMKLNMVMMQIISRLTMIMVMMMMLQTISRLTLTLQSPWPSSQNSPATLPMYLTFKWDFCLEIHCDFDDYDCHATSLGMMICQLS